jgi:DNA anti-recombination protein RmuC
MNLQQAVMVIDEALAALPGTRQQHIQRVAALRTLEAAALPPAPPPGEPEVLVEKKD